MIESITVQRVLYDIEDSVSAACYSYRLVYDTIHAGLSYTVVYHCMLYH